MNTRFHRVTDPIAAERARQRALLIVGAIRFDCATLPQRRAELLAEIVQVAAVATAWAESLLEEI